ncbi:MAG: hypothetical protein C4562_04065 [Actinobacteria bacterium]|nr:MAG: hypothetical protein C4562_04065 [Actinomycetota bacterium]
MKKFFCLLLSLFLLLAMVSAVSLAVNADIVYEGSCDQASTVYAAKRVAQSFTPTTTASYTSVSIYSRKIGTPGTITAEIYATDSNGYPTGNAIATSINIDASSWSTGYEWHSIEISKVQLNNGVKYVLWIKGTGTDSSNCVAWGRDSTDPSYAGGNMVGADPWVNYTDYDQLFKILTCSGVSHEVCDNCHVGMIDIDHDDCIKCHDGTLDGHQTLKKQPPNIVAQFAKPSHHPFTMTSEEINPPGAMKYKTTWSSTGSGVTNSACMACHNNMGDVDSNGQLFPRLLKSRDEQTALFTFFGNNYCYTCHGAAGDKVGGSTIEFEASAHNRIGSPGSGSEIKCMGCHEIHGSNSAWLTPKNEENLCFDCHDDLTNGYNPKRATTPKGWNIYKQFTDSISSHDVLSVTGAKVECTNCHGFCVEPDNKMANPNNTMERYNGTRTGYCLECHDGNPPTEKHTNTEVVPYTVQFPNITTMNRNLSLSQEDWTGGPYQDEYGNYSKYLSSQKLDYSVAGELSLMDKAKTKTVYGSEEYLMSQGMQAIWWPQTTVYGTKGKFTLKNGATAATLTDSNIDESYYAPRLEYNDMQTGGQGYIQLDFGTSKKVGYIEVYNPKNTVSNAWPITTVTVGDNSNGNNTNVALLKYYVNGNKASFAPIAGRYLTLISSTGTSYGGCTANFYEIKAYAGGYVTEGSLISSQFNAGNQVEYGKLVFDADVPSDTELKFQLGEIIETIIDYDENGPIIERIEDFRGPDGSTNTYYTTSGQPIWQGLNNKKIRYKVYFSSTDDSKTPVLRRVGISAKLPPDPNGVFAGWDKSNYLDSKHNPKYDCNKCHHTHSSNRYNLLAYDLEDESVNSSTICLKCHEDGNTEGATDIKTLVTAKTYKHYKNTSAHSNVEPINATANKEHAACNDCHDPHVADDTNTSSLRGANKGSAGQNLDNSVANPVDNEAQMCKKCHTDTIFRRFYDSAPLGQQIRQMTIQTVNYNQEFDPAQNVSGHPVYGAANRSNIPAERFVNGWNGSKEMTCSDCHNEMHGSNNRYFATGIENADFSIIPDGAGYVNGSPRVYTNSPDNVMCLKCHNKDYYFDGLGTNVRNHNGHVANGDCMYCHRVHSSNYPDLLNGPGHHSGCHGGSGC